MKANFIDDVLRWTVYKSTFCLIFFHLSQILCSINEDEAMAVDATESTLAAQSWMLMFTQHRLSKLRF